MRTQVQLNVVDSPIRHKVEPNLGGTLRSIITRTPLTYIVGYRPQAIAHREPDGLSTIYYWCAYTECRIYLAVIFLGRSILT